MVGFKKTYFCLVIFAAAVASFAAAGCGFGSGAAGGAQNSPAAENAENSVPAASRAESGLPANGETDGGTAGGRQRKSKGIEKRILFDGSQYVVMRDGYGNKVEYRYFEPKTGVKYISLQTSADGTASVEVRTWDGYVKQIDSSGIGDPWRVSPRDVALLAGFPLEFQFAETAPAAAAAVTQNPVVPLPATSVVSKQLEAPAKSVVRPGEEKPEQTLEPQTETPRQEAPDQSAALRRMLGNSF